MITSAENGGWPDDIDLGAAYTQVGLTVPCVIRPAKIASISEDMGRRMGRLPDPLLQRVLATLRFAGP